MSVWLTDGGTDQYPATWRGVIVVLEDVECYEVARKLEKVLKSAVIPTNNAASVSPQATTPFPLAGVPANIALLLRLLPPPRRHLLSLLLPPSQALLAAPTPQLLLVSLSQQPAASPVSAFDELQ